MLDKSLKIFGLDNNFSLDELEEKYKKLLKEFDTKNIEDDLKVVFLEEQVRIREAYQILLKHCHEREKVSSREPKEKTLPVKAGNKKLRNIVFAICAAFVLISLFSIISNPPKKAPPKGDNKEIVDSGEEEEKKAIQCKGTIKEGRRCKRKTTNISGYCYDHEKQEENKKEEEKKETRLELGDLQMDALEEENDYIYDEEKLLIGFKIKTKIREEGIYERKLLDNGEFISYRDGEYITGKSADKWWVEDDILYIYYNDWITYQFFLQDTLTTGTWSNKAPDSGTCQVTEYSERILFKYLGNR
ncbi:MAG: hypothetical protein HOH88_03210 [Flavobacteriales bacterium]|jgi:hypothetical protein|nr:hypothetical protein [Flavobacteriales bacterium]